MFPGSLSRLGVSTTDGLGISYIRTSPPPGTRFGRGGLIGGIVGFTLDTPLALITFTPRFWPTAAVFVLLGDKDLYKMPQHHGRGEWEYQVNEFRGTVVLLDH